MLPADPHVASTTTSRVTPGKAETAVLERRRDTEIHACHAAQGRDKGGKNERMARIDTTQWVISILQIQSKRIFKKMPRKTDTYFRINTMVL